MNTRQTISTREVERSLWIRKVLVPVDFSASSTIALQYATALAREFHATVTLLHVVQLNIAGEERGVPRTQFLNQLGKSAERQLHELADLVQTPEIASEVVVRTGRPHEEVLNAAHETNADLIIMAAHGNSGLLRWLRPRTAERVVRLAPCPVLVLRATQQPFVLQLPTDR